MTFDLPPIGPRSGKIWGRTQLVFARNDTEAHVIEINKGGFCSCHSHKFKWNRFCVLSGELIVRTYGENGFVDETSVRAGQINDVPPGIRHEFEAKEDTVAMEFYWIHLDPDDINRFQTHGGVKKENDISE